MSYPALFKTPLNCKNHTIISCYKQLEHQKQLLLNIREVLPDAISKQALHCLIKKRKLIVYTDSANWASLLRFYQKTIISGAEKFTSTPIESIQIRVITEQVGVNQQAVYQAKIPSSTVIGFLDKQSSEIKDKDLQISIRKLSVTLRRLADQNSQSQ